MITFNNIKRYFSSTTDTGPWTYLFYDANNTGCVSFSNASGTTASNNATTNVSFTNSLCIEEADIRIRVEGINGCVSTALIEFEDPCSTFDVSEITYGSNLQFSVTATGGTAPYTYEWFFDENTFESSNANTNAPTLSLLVVEGSLLPVSTDVVVKVTDMYGCTDTKTYTHTFCVPVANSSTYALSCLGTTGSAYNAMVFMNVTACTSVAIDWSLTPVFSNVPSGMTITHPYSQGNTAAPVNRLIVSTANSVTPGTYSVYYTVKDVNGITSTTGTLTFIVPTCQEGVAVTPITIQNRTIQIDCSVNEGDIVEIDISNDVQPDTFVDWTSLLFTASGTDQMATVLGLADGYDHVTTPNVTYSAVQKKIYYEVPAGSGSDSFQWSISTSTTPVLVSNGVVYTMLLDCINPPTAVNDTACVICGEPVEIEILSNDDPEEGVINTNSVVITSGPSHGTVELSLDGVVTYTANTGYTGTDEFTYTVDNNENTPQTSNEATVEITIICAGQPASISICN